MGESEEVEKVYKLCLVHKFSAAHFLPGHKGKCRNLHGHTWKVQVDIRVNDLIEGMVVDFGDIKAVIDSVDHVYLNNVLENPTAENIAEYIYNRLKDDDFIDLEVTVWESENASISYKEGR